jgi:RNA polymerase sigma factor (sigma-70 family)
VPIPPFQNFLDDHRDDVYRFLVASVGPVDADDCFQETFLAALRAYPRLRANSNLRAWVITIANRKALDNHRARKRRPTPQAEPPESIAAERNGFDAELWSTVAELPAKQRTAVLHRYVNDLPYADIARVMDCSPEAARRNVHEGLRTLREQPGAWTK